MAENKKEDVKILSESDLEKVAGGDPIYKWCPNCQHYYWLNSQGECPNCHQNIA